MMWAGDALCGISVLRTRAPSPMKNQLTSSRWFAVTMGTGIVSVLLTSIPFHTPALYYLSITFFILNTILFALAMTTSILRYTLYPEIWSVMIKDPVNSLFLATIPMGFATLIEMWVLVCVPLWGEWAKTVAWVLWMVDVVAAASVTLSISFILSVTRLSTDACSIHLLTVGLEYLRTI